jgi:uncharacterized protein
MDLKSRLERLGVRKGTEHLQPRPRVDAPRVGAGPNSIERLAPGRAISNEHGSFYLVEETYPLAYQHGSWALGDLLGYSVEDILPLARDDSLEDLDFGKAIFVDTETTGLAGGTGTYAFLVGIGFLDGDQFRLWQFFMRDPAEERAMLAEMVDMLAPFSSLVSFNGRSFDWPLMRTRFIMSRQRPPLVDAPHLDLLHLARRLWRTRLPSCALSSLEQNVLGVARKSEDVAGWIIPHLYFDYLETGDAGPMLQVLYHNAQDILSLVTLSAYLGQIGRDPYDRGLAHGEDYYSLGRYLERLRDWDEAIRAYKHALSCPLDDTVRADDSRQLSLLLKRRGRREQAVELWEAELNAGRLYPYVELAKHHEHQEGDLGRAAKLVEEAITLVQSPTYLAGWRRDRDLAELEHRLNRLKRKLGEAE